MYLQCLETARAREAGARHFKISQTHMLALNLGQANPEYYYLNHRLRL